MVVLLTFNKCSTPADVYFLTEKDLDNCVTERILRNRYYDPLISSDSDEEERENIDWDKIFEKKKDNEKQGRVYVPALHSLPPYPKISALTSQQHYQCLKVLCQENPHIMPSFFIHRPTKLDLKVFEQVKETYANEQKEYIDWVKGLWATNHCIRALRPKPSVEMVYEAEFKVTANMMQSFPKTYHLVGQIPLEIANGNCEIIHLKDLQTVNISELPEIRYPDDIKSKFSIFKPYNVPEPCYKHPCRFVLPGEKSMTTLPLAEIHRELAQYAGEHGAQFVAAEGALRSLVRTDRRWALPLTVCSTIGVDGDESNVIVLGNEFSLNREPACVRTYKAFKHLLENALKQPSTGALSSREQDAQGSLETSFEDESEDGSTADSEDEQRLVIDTGDMDTDKERDENELASPKRSRRSEGADSGGGGGGGGGDQPQPANDELGVYSCTCDESSSARPPPCSFRKWQINNKTHKEVHNIVVHCEHRVRHGSQEVVLEPIPEYQIDVGASLQAAPTRAALLLALLLRRDAAALLNVRVEGPTGDVVCAEQLSTEQLSTQQPSSQQPSSQQPSSQQPSSQQPTCPRRDVGNTLGCVLSQLTGLLPGHYVLKHEPEHGRNALLLAAGAGGGGGGALGRGARLELQFDCAQLAEQDEAGVARTPPTLAPILLPYHKYRKILPCAFTPFQNQVAREPRKPVARQKTPPQAIQLHGASEEGAATRKWPKKKRNRSQRKKKTPKTDY
ncbi:uncharacterized protein LOC101741349 isoform X2 [Bombyx mori]|uniref:Little elongation complex subunit 2 C-terminal domain-containing protein n=1 Tax=Bombyx mori TaxID=7091 RepID=A0A8R2M0A1_BOMMO|nr:uncharacterized protein LOC101741349 isoform X4 [Bombyx mori]